MISGKFLKSTVAYSVAGSLPMLSGFILLPFYTNLLTTSDYGLLMLYIGFSLLIQIVVSYSLDAYLGAHYTEVKYDEKRRKELLSNLAGLLLVIGASFILIALVLGKPVFDLTFNRSGELSYFPFGIMSVMIGFFNSFFKTYTYLLVFEKKPGAYLLFNVVNFALTIIISIIGLYMYPDSLIGPMYGRLLSGLGIFSMALIGFLYTSGISFRFHLLKNLHVFCLPYVMYVILTWVSANVDRFIINDVMNAEAVAIFDFAIKCALLIDFVQAGIMSAIYPEVFEIWNRNKATGTSPESNKYFHSFTGLTLLMTCLFMIAVPLLIPVFVKKTAFYESFIFMGVLVGSFATRGAYFYFVSILLYLKKTNKLLIVFGLSAVIQLPATWWLTKNWGLDGAVVAAFLAKVVQVFFLYIVTRKLFEIRMNVMKLIVLPGCFMIALVCLWIFTDEWNVWWYAGLLAIVSVLLLLQYKNEIRGVWDKFVKRKFTNTHES